MLKYEDLVTSPVSTLKDLYSSLSLDFDLYAIEALYNHTRATKDNFKHQEQNKMGLSYYYSTYRRADNDIHKWKKELSLDKIHYVEQNCIEFMQKVGYTIKTE